MKLVAESNENIITLVVPRLTLVRVFSCPDHNKQQALRMFFRNLSIPGGEDSVKIFKNIKQPNLPANVSWYICDNNGVSRLDMVGYLPSRGQVRIADVRTVRFWISTKPADQPWANPWP
jgi:hypothetical protein